jgi:hypothetical protein
MKELFQKKGQTRKRFGGLEGGTTQGAESAALDLDSALKKCLLEVIRRLSIGAAQTSLLGQRCRYLCSVSWSSSWIHLVFYFENDLRAQNLMSFVLISMDMNAPSW